MFHQWNPQDRLSYCLSTEVAEDAMERNIFAYTATTCIERDRELETVAEQETSYGTIQLLRPENLAHTENEFSLC